ncbi:MAG: ABC transporter ATP-binding protein [Phototrophicaceae bacterium]|jgi:ABC-type sugar transport system ATPase subunit
MTAVEFRNVQKAYKGNPVLRDISLTIEQGSFTVIYGAPGCGKSLLLRLLAGLEMPDKGQILLRGVDATRLSPEKRNLGYVPQSFALYPHYSVYDNIAYPLTLAGMKKTAIRPIVERTAESLKISHLLKKSPHQLSGGEKQRVAIARGIVKESTIFILDDPLTGLDFKLREQLFEDLRQMKDDLQATFIYTTSDALEALMLAEQIQILDVGSIIEAGNLEAVYQDPQQVRTVLLLGFPEANIFHGKLYHEGNHARLETAIFEVRFDGSAFSAFTEGMAVNVVLRPQDVKINPEKSNGILLREAEIMLVEDLGGEMVCYLEANGILLRAVVGHGAGIMTDRISCTIGIHPNALLLYAPETGQRIGLGRN